MTANDFLRALSKSHGDPYVQMVILAVQTLSMRKLIDNIVAEPEHAHVMNVQLSELASGALAFAEIAVRPTTARPFTSSDVMREASQFIAMMERDVLAADGEAPTLQ